MKQVLKVMIVVLCLATSFVSKAVATDEITLTVSSDGPTKDDAVKNALRTAIEQSYGAFVSANTSILNDELVKDEIVTVSNGSIKDYKEISSVKTGDGTYSVTLSATVSLPHLITYAKNHGSECEFAGNTFGMEMKLFELQKENELKALYNLIPVMVDVAKNNMTWKMNVAEPRLADIKFEKEISTSTEYTEGTEPDGYQYATGTIEIGGVNFGGDRLCLERIYEHIPDLLNHPIKRKDGKLGLEKDDSVLSIIESMTEGKYAIIRFDLFWMSIAEDAFINELNNKIKSISLDRDTYDHFKDLGLNVTNIREALLSKSPFFRNNEKDISLWYDSLMDALNKIKNDFVIKDNTGQISDFSPLQLADYKDIRRMGCTFWRNFLAENILDDNEIDMLCKEKIQNTGVKVQLLQWCDDGRVERWPYSRGAHVFSFPGKIRKVYDRDVKPGFTELICIGGKGIFSQLFLGSYNGDRLCPDDWYRAKNIGGIPSWTIYAFIPMAEIGKYSSFTIGPRE